MVENSYPISNHCTKIILKQMTNSIYKLEGRDIKLFTCFFSHIKYRNKRIPVLFSTYPELGLKYFSNKNEIEVSKNHDKLINIKLGKTIYLNSYFSIFVVEIEENNQIEYLEIDEALYEKESESFFYKKPIYIIDYNKNKKETFVFYGNIRNIKNNELILSCNINFAHSNSSPVLSLYNNKVLGLFNADYRKKNQGIFLKNIIKEFINEYIKTMKRLKSNKIIKNEIKIYFDIKQNDINENIYFLDKYNNMKELNIFKTEIYLNYSLIKKEDNKKFFKPDKEGKFYIKLTFDGYLTDSSYMFSGCKKIKEINFIKFHTNNITNMEYMFYECSNLKNINLFSFDTINVINMRYMFYKCINLINFDFSSFNTKKVINMSNMFNECENTKFIDLTYFDTKNVIDMSNMFNKCKNLINVELSSFDTQNVTDMRYMFNECRNLINLDLSSFDTRKTKEVSNIFFGCSKLNNLNSLIHNIKNISNNDYEIYEAIIHKNKINGDFKENPTKLKFKCDLVNNGITQYSKNNFEVFIGLKDKKEYIVYQNSKNHNIDIMEIKFRIIVKSLKGRNTINTITVIKYFMKDINEDYLLSCDYSGSVIIWDIQNNFNIKYELQSGYFGKIHHAILLFNIHNENYIVLSSSNVNIFAMHEPSKLYKFEDGTPFVKDIDNTEENYTHYIIPWLYNKQHYIIELCSEKISINNIFKNENYADLSLEPEGKHYCGYLYNEKYLCVCDSDNSNIRIWDLVNKIIIKQINYNASYGYEIIPWNDKYAVVGCGGGFVIINIEEGKPVEYIEVKDCQVIGLKKISINQYGEYLILSTSKNYYLESSNLMNIKLFSISNNY